MVLFDTFKLFHVLCWCF